MNEPSSTIRDFVWIAYNAAQQSQSDRSIAALENERRAEWLAWAIHKDTRDATATLAAIDGDGVPVLLALEADTASIVRHTGVTDGVSLFRFERLFLGRLEDPVLRTERPGDRGESPVTLIELEHDRLPGKKLVFPVEERDEKWGDEVVDALRPLLGRPGHRPGDSRQAAA